jgi:histidinol dehydrogenase
MRVVRWDELEADARARLIERPAGMRMFDPELREGVVAIVEDVHRRGDAAVLEALQRFDGCTVPPGELRVGEAEFAAARDAVGADVVTAIRDGIDHCKRFNERVLQGADWRLELEPGLVVGEQSSPISSVGLFVPSGKGSYPSVLVQLGSPAVVAGVPEVAVVVPPMPGSDGRVDPAVLIAADELGLRTVLRANGPAGVAALAFGTESFPKVRKVVGPGSPPVACAQIEIQRYGCATQILLGPSESLILADSSADPRLLAADLLNEAEHGMDSTSVLVTEDERLVEAAQEHLTEQLGRLPEPRRSYATAALGVNGGTILVADLEQGVEVANAFAPEHMQLVVRDEDAVLAALHHAGEILLGQWTPISAANYVIGVPAALPTGRFARVTSGITAETFTKKTSIAKADARALERLAPTVLALAEHEGFPAHAAAVRARLHGTDRSTQGGLA